MDVSEAEPTGTDHTAVDQPDPAVTIDSLTFSDGTTISLQPRDVVVLVGPNNAGKSVALRDLEGHVQGQGFNGTVVTRIQLQRTGELADLRRYLDRHAPIRSQGRNPHYTGYRFSMQTSQVSRHWPGPLGPLAGFFCNSLQTETRIVGSDPPRNFNVLRDSPSTPIQMLYRHDDLERRMCAYFKRAFGKDLVVHKGAGSEIPLLVGKRPPLEPGEDRTSGTYCQRLEDATVPLREQGDGMRSFTSVILHLLATTTPSVLILDEPEAFLHPPQAALLGELLASERPSRAQLFVATHSADVLTGLLKMAPGHLRVLRLHREGDINRVTELDKEKAKAIGTDALMRYSSVLSGIFHERAIICEGDADCMFYNSILDLPEVHGTQRPDVVFVHGGGKDRISRLAAALRELGVSVDVIVDIDILNGPGFEALVESLGGSPRGIQTELRTVRDAVTRSRLVARSDEVVREIEAVLVETDSNQVFPRAARRSIEAILKRTGSPWQTLKQAGEAGLPHGQATQALQNLSAYCRRIGLWLVAVGELEGFWRSVGGKGPSWARGVIEERDLATEPELQAAREFVREIWESRRTDSFESKDARVGY